VPQGPIELYVLLDRFDRFHFAGSGTAAPLSTARHRGQDKLVEVKAGRVPMWKKVLENAGIVRKAMFRH
jgi:hypothetical protein